MNIMEQYGSEIMSLVSAVVASIITWLSTRKKQKVDTKQIEVDVLEKSLQVIHKDVVEPLRLRFVELQDDYSRLSDELKIVKNAINKMYSCRMLNDCPIRIELQKHKVSGRKGNASEQRTNRPRDSTDRERDQTGDSSSDNSETDT